MKSYFSFSKLFLLGMSMIAILMVTVAPLLAEEEKKKKEKNAFSVC